MPSDDYISTPSTGKLKLKGVKESKVTKKKKHNPIKDDKPTDGVQDNSVMLKKLEEEDREMEKAGRKKHGKADQPEDEEERREELASPVKTEAERRYEEQRRKRVRNACPFLSIPRPYSSDQTFRKLTEHPNPAAR